MDKNKLTQFLLKARTKTYAGHSGRVKPLLVGSKQLEYKEDNWLYRDIFNIGNNKFAGLETIYFKNKPIWSMSYYGNFISILSSVYCPLTNFPSVNLDILFGTPL